MVNLELIVFKNKDDISIKNSQLGNLKRDNKLEFSYFTKYTLESTRDEKELTNLIGGCLGTFGEVWTVLHLFTNSNETTTHTKYYSYGGKPEFVCKFRTNNIDDSLIDIDWNYENNYYYFNDMSELSLLSVLKSFDIYKLGLTTDKDYKDRYLYFIPGLDIMVDEKPPYNMRVPLALHETFCTQEEIVNSFEKNIKEAIDETLGIKL